MPASKVRLIGPSKAGSDNLNLTDIEDRLKKRVIGQDDAIRIISDCIRVASVGLNEPNRPIASFSFVGRTGVGKTELAKALSHCLFGDEKGHFVRVDCSEYSQAHEYAKLIGSPPGYIGHGDGGFLTEAVKQKKSSVVLFDEIEKAHPKVHNLLLQILDDGILTDSKGACVDFSQCIIVMTSNIGVKPLDSIEKSVGFIKEKINHTRIGIELKKDFERSFVPEFINRIDEIVVFRELNGDDKENISVKMLHDMVRRSDNSGHRLKFTQALAKYIANSTNEGKYGARPLHRAIRRLIAVPLSKKIMDNEFEQGAIILMDIKNGEVVFSEVKRSRKN
jgi:ATP-dependent Clp protease ATP-binding subunit ClpC